jgi:hypothetical protein
MLEASGVPTAACFKGAAEAAEAKSAVAPIMERIVFIPNFLVTFARFVGCVGSSGGTGKPAVA